MYDESPRYFWKDFGGSRRPGVDDKECTVSWTDTECSRVACLHFTVVRVSDIVWGGFCECGADDEGFTFPWDNSNGFLVPWVDEEDPCLDDLYIKEMNLFGEGSNKNKS